MLDFRETDEYLEVHVKADGTTQYLKQHGKQGVLDLMETLQEHVDYLNKYCNEQHYFSY